jgi:hypothetical protein
MLTFRETWAKETGNLLDKGLGRKESVVFFSELLYKLLVRVQPIFLNDDESKLNEMAAVLFQIINRHVLQLYLLSTIDISSICENANGHARTGTLGSLYMANVSLDR